MSERFTFFYHSSSPFSQWFTGAPFIKFGIRFKTAENFMMWRKGLLFDAPQSLLDDIIKADSREAKRIGRDIANFDEKVWNAAAKSFVFEGNIAKFAQNPQALTALLLTEGTTLVEASPRDRIWGIGLAEHDSRAWNRDTWLGTNWLGEVLTDVCHTFVNFRHSYVG